MKKISLIILCVVGFLSIFLIGGGMALLGRTFVEWHVPVTAALLSGIILILLTWRTPFLYSKLFASWITATMAFVFTCSLCFFSFLALNYFCADESTAHNEEVTVMRKFTREKTRYRRVGKGRMVANGKYHTYHVEMQTPNGNTKEVELSLEKYNRTKKNFHTEIKVAEGLFGYYVITDYGKL